MQYNGGPVISGDNYCTDCIFEDARAAASADTYRDQRMYMKEVIEDVLNGRGLMTRRTLCPELGQSQPVATIYLWFVSWQQ